MVDPYLMFCDQRCKQMDVVAKVICLIQIHQQRNQLFLFATSMPLDNQWCPDQKLSPDFLPSPS